MGSYSDPQGYAPKGKSKSKSKPKSDVTKVGQALKEAKNRKHKKKGPIAKNNPKGSRPAF